ncbi:serine hydrolase domain-containing protein [Jeotgalibacillus terrae]|uniref:Serine hydrolase domain-containing protein n=1 Tax=Jeotgalibacillus terrae TaxID=587735 RepID=A0ABW5ZK70_9BACL|nr:serine hydrolase domain-containing protein [Jeotgalibacillus terrae]MBM7578063.1 CubicO group peptidase (beta-lactamase class C family) [Jeotgalibacillus terrae]
MNITTTQDSFTEITAYTEKIRQDMHASGSALLIMKDNRIVHESYAGAHHFQEGAKSINAASQFNVYSVRVTYIGLAAAIAVHNGDLNLDDKISFYLDDLDDEVLGESTLRHLLTRCTGLKIKNNAAKRLFEAGTNIEGKQPDIVARIIHKVTGRTVHGILTESVFKPLNMTQTEWVTDSKRNLVCDIHSPESFPSLRLGSNEGDERNLYVSARELACWGNLHLHKGFIEGKQILPREVFDLAVKVQSPDTMPDHLPKHGFFWWVKHDEVSYEFDELGSNLPEGSYQILGASGCSCTVIPDLNVVAVRMYNSLYTDELEKFDYIRDIRTFGDLVVSGIKNETTQV